MSERPPHSDTPNCACFRCHIGTLQVRTKPQTKGEQFRGVTQPHGGNPLHVEKRPGGGEVPVFDETGRLMRRKDAYERSHAVDEMRRRTHTPLPSP